MPDSREISALIIAESTSASDLFETAIPNAMTETGYVSRKVTLGTIANFLLNTLLYQALNTTTKTIIGAINELAQGSGHRLDTLNDVDIDDQTLTNGQGIVYDATSQKWKNGTVGGGGGHTYSTTEQVVGTWIDGSTLYEKTIAISNIHTGKGSTDFLVGANVEIVDISGCYKVGTGGRNWSSIVIDQYGDYGNEYAVYAGFVYNDGSGYIRIATNTDRSALVGYVIVHYTKSSS